MNQPAYYANIPANVRYDARLKPAAKLLYGEITALTSKEGYCWAENEYFAGLYNVSISTVSRWISQLRDYGYIGVEILQKEGNKRKITIDEKRKTSKQKSQYLCAKKSIPLDKKSKPIYENTTINTTKNTIYATAIEFLEKNNPQGFETFCMQNKNRIGGEWVKFCENFNENVILEKLDWESPILMARLRKLASNWNSNSGVVKMVPADGGLPAYMNKKLT